MKISVIIPALNEAALIKRAVSQAAGRAEVIVVDGGSTDGTPLLASFAGAKVISSAPGRGAQMDAGAEAAKGGALLFLHADTILPENWPDAIRSALSDKKNVAGAFRLSIASDKARYRIIEYFANLRSGTLGLIYGDQAIFARRDVFLDSGGFKKLPLMEDLDCVKRLREKGAVVLIKDRTATSARRWEKGGFIRTTLKNWLFLILYSAGVSPERLYGWYYNKPRPFAGKTTVNRFAGKGPNVRG